MGFALQICAALEHAHEKGAIHRDLKPANIYVLPDGTIKVLDFGLAEFDLNRSSLLQAAGAKKEDLEAALGASPLRAGTPAYMAPEQWHGQPQDVRTHLFHECYKRLPGDEGETAGELRLKVKIDSNGSPTGSILWSEVGDPRMPECIIQKLELISFPKPGKTVTFTLPFRFGTM